MFFNEAFWLVYFADVLTEVRVMSAILLVLGIVGIFVILIATDTSYKSGATKAEYEYLRKKYISRLVAGMLVCFLVGTVTPSRTAIYAGAAQYVVEVTEVDATVMTLKQLLDSKIEELGEENSDDD